MKPQPPWEDENGVQVLRLYKSEKHPDWPQDVNKEHFYPDWPRVVLLDLTADQFEEFHRDPLAFAGKYKLYPPEESISWMSHVAMPPIGKGIPRATDSSRWTVAIIHTPQTIAICAACPHSTTK